MTNRAPTDAKKTRPLSSARFFLSNLKHSDQRPAVGRWSLFPIPLAGATPPDAPLTEACRAASQEKPGAYTRVAQSTQCLRGQAGQTRSEPSSGAGAERPFHIVEFGEAPTYSRLARPTFRHSPGHLPLWGVSSLNLAGLPSGFPALFGKLSGNGVGALVGRIFKINSPSTPRLAASSVSNSEGQIWTL